MKNAAIFIAGFVVAIVLIKLVVNKGSMKGKPAIIEGDSSVVQPDKIR